MSTLGFLLDKHRMHGHIANPFSYVTRDNHHAMTGLCVRQVSTREKEQASRSHGVKKKESQFREPNTTTMIRQGSDILPPVGAIQSSGVCEHQAEGVFPMPMPRCFSMPLFQGNNQCGCSGERPYEAQSQEASLPLLAPPTHLPDPSNGMSKDCNNAAPVLNMGAFRHITNSPAHTKDHHIPIDDLEDEEYFAFPPRSFHPVDDSVLHRLDIMPVPVSSALKANSHNYHLTRSER